MKRKLLLVLLILICGQWLVAQTSLRLQIASSPSLGLQQASDLRGTSTDSIRFQQGLAAQPISPAWLPQYAIDNPTGYSFLCRTELAVERKLPVGVWVRTGENSLLQGQIMSTSHFRLRLPLR